MKYKEFYELLVPLSEELNKYQQKLIANSIAPGFELELKVERGYLSTRTADDMIVSLKCFEPFSYSPFSFSFLIRDQNGKKLFSIKRHEPPSWDWVLNKLSE
jgi:hypothetical protein